MAADNEEKEARILEEMTEKAEILIEEDDSKKDLKEQRGIRKQALYDGSKKLKHILPKGKNL